MMRQLVYLMLLVSSIITISPSQVSAQDGQGLACAEYQYWIRLYPDLMVHPEVSILDLTIASDRVSITFQRQENDLCLSLSDAGLLTAWQLEQFELAASVTHCEIDEQNRVVLRENDIFIIDGTNSTLTVVVPREESGRAGDSLAEIEVNGNNGFFWVRGNASNLISTYITQDGTTLVFTLESIGSYLQRTNPRGVHQEIENFYRTEFPGQFEWPYGEFSFTSHICDLRH